MLVGYEMIVANSYQTHACGIIITPAIMKHLELETQRWLSVCILEPVILITKWQSDVKVTVGVL